MALLNRRGSCKGNDTTNLDLSLKLQNLIKVAGDILTEVKNHTVNSLVDLSPIVDKLTAIFGAMTDLKTSAQATTSAVESLQAQFLAEVAKIEGFQSQNLTLLSALAAVIKAGDDQTNAILQAQYLLLAEANRLKSIKRYPYDCNYICGNTPVTIVIPEGCVELLVATECYAYKSTVNGTATWYDAGDDLCVDFRNTSVGVISEPAYKLEFPAGAKLHIKYSALSDIGNPSITVGTVTEYDGTEAGGSVALANAVNAAHVVIGN